MTLKKADSVSDNDNYVSSVEDRIKTLSKGARTILSNYQSDENMQKKIAYLNEAKEQGNIGALYLLGKEYERGLCVAKDVNKAIELYTQAAEKGHKKAAERLIELYYNDKDDDKRYTRAMNVINKYASNTSGYANYIRGQMYLYGQGVEFDSKKGLHYLILSAFFGNYLPTIKLLGNLYENGYQLNNSKSLIIPQDLISAAKYHEMAAKQGDRESQYKAAMVKLEGKGTSKDYHGAFLWLWKSALQSYGLAQIELAKFYVSDYLFPKDFSTALLWLLISQNNIFNEEVNNLINEYEPNIPKAKSRKLQKEAIDVNKDIKAENKINSDLLLMPEPYLELYGFDAKEEMIDDSIETIIPNESDYKDSTSNCNMVPSNYEDKVDEEEENDSEIEISTSLQYKHINQLGKSFDPSKIKLELLLNKSLNSADDVDFDELKISYNNQHCDRKEVELFTSAPVKLNRKARILLIKLALQFDTKDSEKRTSNIARILRNPDLSGDVVSTINRLAKTLFPGCFNKSCPFICKGTGELKISLAIAKWNIENAKDFKEVSRIN